MQTDIISILDNADTYRAKIVQHFIIKVGVIVLYLPTYSPELAPAELYFAQMKSTLQASIITEILI